jgi:3-methyladenine DNA glycosylase AlkC
MPTRSAAPLLVVQGANDPRVLQVESDEIVAAVKKNGVPVEYVVFPDEGHGFQKKSNRITASETYLAFCRKFLLPQPSPHSLSEPWPSRSRITSDPMSRRGSPRASATSPRTSIRAGSNALHSKATRPSTSWRAADTSRPRWRGSCLPTSSARARFSSPSLGPPLERTEGNGMAPFFYLPHVLFVARQGLDHFEASMRAHYELTQRFTAEFGIRPLIEKYPERCVQRFHEWTTDRSVHVRRLVSEGTRPRLPWAARLRCFEKDPSPTIELLERLKDDPEEYVRRSVANHLNDIGKDHPKVLVDTARRWLRGADENRDRLIRHALRSSIKRADPATLELLGYGRASKSTIERTSITPRRAVIGGSVTLEVEIENRGKVQERTLIDLVVHFVKSNGSTSPKVFKLAEATIEPRSRQTFTKKISLAQHTTRKHFPGEHRVDAQMNGRIIALGSFALRA